MIIPFTTAVLQRNYTIYTLIFYILIMILCKHSPRKIKFQMPNEYIIHLIRGVYLT